MESASRGGGSSLELGLSVMDSSAQRRGEQAQLSWSLCLGDKEHRNCIQLLSVNCVPGIYYT